MEWELVLYRTAANNGPVAEYLKGLPDSDAAKVNYDLKMLRELGPRNPSTKHLRGKIYEVRTRGTVQHRVFFAAISGQRIILLHAFTKKTQKAPERDIVLAEKRYADFLSRE